MNGYLATNNGPNALYVYFRPDSSNSFGHTVRYGVESNGEALHELWPDGRVRSQPIPLESFAGVDGLIDAIQKL